MKKRKLNIKLLRRIQAHITEEPRRFFMEYFFARVEDGEWENRYWSDLSSSPPPCGTAGCIAGWANSLTGGSDMSDVDRAEEKLGLTQRNRSCCYLFGATCWPNQFRDRYSKAKTPKTRAKIACERIDHLIATGE